MARHEYEIMDYGDFDALCVQGHWGPEAEAAISSGEVDGVWLNRAWGFEGPDLEFLRDLPIRRLHVLVRDLTDLGPISTLGRSLEYLSVQASPKALLNLRPLAGLRQLSADWKSVRSTLASVPQVEHLSLRNYGDSDFGVLASFLQLQTLDVISARRLKTLCGLERTALSALQVNRASQLVDISPLARLSSSLEKLWLEDCRRLEDLAGIEQLRNLRELWIDDRGQVASLQAIAGLPKLEVLVVGTRVADADLTPVQSLPALRELRVQSRREYRPTVAELNAKVPRWDREGT